MEDKKLKKIGVAAVSASVLTAGTIAFAAAYQSGTAFDPSGSNRDLKTNQVVFSDDDDSVGHKKGSDKKESEMLNKDQNEQEKQNTARSRAQADYLFDNDVKLTEDSQNSAMINDGNDNLSSGNLLDDVAQTPGSKPGTILDITGDAGNADVILPGGNGSGTGTGTDDNGNGGTGGSGNGVGGNGSGGNGSGGNGGGNGTGGNTGTTVRPADTVADPDEGKYIPSGSFIPVKSYTETIAKQNPDNINITIIKPMDESAPKLYKGQTVDIKKIFNALQTSVYNKNDGLMYVWDETALNKYIRIDAVSLDGGNTWVNTFPLTIPTDIEDGQFLIKVSYRLTEMEDWKNYKDNVSYAVEDNALWVLKEKLTENSKVLDQSNALTFAKRYPQIGEEVNLYYAQTEYLGDDGTKLTELFPGWTENGKLVPWFYSTTTPGRHILEPMDKVELGKEYQAEVRRYWLNTGLCYLQTMTDYELPSLLDPDNTGIAKKEYQEVKVPQYIQSVDIDDNADLSVEYLEIPDTVININGSSRGIKVNQGYIVDSDDSYYAVTDEGILTNKEGTEYEAIPYKVKKITIPDNVSKVNLQGLNQVNTITIEADTVEKLPELTFYNPEEPSEETQECKILLKDDLLEQFAMVNMDILTEANKKYVSAIETPNVTYTVSSDGQLIGSNKELRKVLGYITNTIRIDDDDISIIKENALSDSGITRILMPADGKNVKLEKNWFANSSLQTILCYSQEQYDYVYAELKEEGAETRIHVELMDKSNIQTSKEGFTYYTQVEDGQVKGILVSAPKDITNFDGTVTTQENTPVEITSISSNAFANCKNLVWVELPESINQIGYSAFKNCESLQGIMINVNDNIDIGDKAFDGCSSLRFIASNAMNAQMQNNYDPLVAQVYKGTKKIFFYVPTNATGYGDNTISFDESSGIASYSLVDIGNDNKMLYGCDQWNTPWLGLRAGIDMGEEAVLPSTTIELFQYAMADTKSSTGAYQVNWEDLTKLGYLDGGAFYASDLGEDIELNEAVCYIDDYAFQKCEKLKKLALSQEGTLQHLGSEVFVECKSLESVEFYEADKNVFLSSNLFYKCDSLKKIKLYSLSEKYTLLLDSDHGEFQFNLAWSKEEELEKLKIEVPDYLETDYIKIWRYAMAGYTRGTEVTDTPYLNMWKTLYNNYKKEHSVWPTDEQIDALMKEKLVESENNLRKMMNLQPVSEPTDFYPYRLSESGELTLIGAPSNITYTFLYGDMLEFPSSWSLDYIATGAFSNSENLNSFATDEPLVGIYPNAFKGVKSNEFTFMFWSSSVPNLIVEKEGTPFDFGIDNSKIISLVVSGGMEGEFINTWSYQLAGYSNRASMEKAVKAEMTKKNGKEPTDEELKAEVDKRVLPYMNLVRKWLGWREADSVETALEESGTGKSTETEPTIPAESGDIQNPEQASESGSATGTGDADTAGNNTSNAGDGTVGDRNNHDATDENISGDHTSDAGDKAASSDTEQDNNVKKEESDSGSQDNGTKEEN